MGTRIKSCVTVFAMACIMLLTVLGEKVLASENEEQIIRQYLYQMYGYDQKDGVEITKAVDLYGADGLSKEFTLYIFQGDLINTGYVIYRLSDGIVVESSQTSIIPYNFETNEEVKFIYYYYLYGTILEDGTVVYRADEADSAYFNRNIDISMTRAMLPSAGNGIYLQEGERNCIACAMAHALVYYKNNGYSDICSVTNQSSFNKLVEKMQEYLKAAGGYANDNIAAAFLKYCMYELNLKGINYIVTADGTWNSQYSQVSEAIAAGNPVMVGFAAGSDYSDEYGHMTLCVGAATLAPEESYLNLIDGHVASIVTKIWNPSINDYISILNASK